MRANTKKRKKATVMLKATQEQEWWADQVVQVMLHGKRALDAAMLDVGPPGSRDAHVHGTRREIRAGLSSDVVWANEMGESARVDLCG